MGSINLKVMKRMYNILSSDKYEILVLLLVAFSHTKGYLKKLELFFGGWAPSSTGDLLQGIKYTVTEGDLTLGGGHTMQYTDDVS